MKEHRQDGMHLLPCPCLCAGTLIPNENFPHGKISRSLKAAYNLIADSNSGFSRDKVMLCNQSQ